MTPEEIIKAHYVKIGHKGGSVSSPRKTKAARRNASKPRSKAKTTTKTKQKQ